MKLRYLLTISALALVGSSVKADMASDIAEIKRDVAFLVSERKLDIQEKAQQRNAAQAIFAQRQAESAALNRGR